MTDFAIQPTKTMNNEIATVAEWMVGDDTGVSSKFIAATWLAGKVVRSYWIDPTPHDDPDLGLCIRLIKKVPAIRSVFPILRDASPVWRIYIDHWDELAALHNDSPKSKRYEIVTARMRELRASVKTESAGRHAAPEILESK
jgi:hypothetical protein